MEEVQKIVRDNIELCLGGNAYSHSRTPQWIQIITDKTLARLSKMNKPFKYIRKLPTILYLLVLSEYLVRIFGESGEWV